MKAARHEIKRIMQCLAFFGSEHTRGFQCERMRLAGSNLFGEELPIKLQRPLPVIKRWIEWLAKAARPHLHFKTSFSSSCCQRAALPEADFLFLLESPPSNMSIRAFCACMRFSA